jgi:hypothetical protein
MKNFEEFLNENIVTGSKGFDKFENTIKINESEVLFFENKDEKFQQEVQASKGFGDAPTISKEESDKLLKMFPEVTDDQVIDLCRYFCLNRVPYPMQIKRSIDARMKENNLSPYKSVNESEVNESTEAMNLVKTFDSPRVPDEPFKRELTKEETAAMNMHFPMYAWSNIDANGNIVLGGGMSSRGKFYITEDDLKKVLALPKVKQLKN